MNIAIHFICLNDTRFFLLGVYIKDPPLLLQKRGGLLLDARIAHCLSLRRGGKLAAESRVQHRCYDAVQFIIAVVLKCDWDVVAAWATQPVFRELSGELFYRCTLSLGRQKNDGHFLLAFQCQLRPITRIIRYSCRK